MSGPKWAFDRRGKKQNKLNTSHLLNSDKSLNQHSVVAVSTVPSQQEHPELSSCVGRAFPCRVCMFSRNLCGFSLHVLWFLPQLKTCTLGFNIQSEPRTKRADEDFNLDLRCCTLRSPRKRMGQMQGIRLTGRYCVHVTRKVSSSS